MIYVANLLLQIQNERVKSQGNPADNGKLLMPPPSSWPVSSYTASKISQVPAATTSTGSSACTPQAEAVCTAQPVMSSQPACTTSSASRLLAGDILTSPSKAAMLDNQDISDLSGSLTDSLVNEAVDDAIPRKPETCADANDSLQEINPVDLAAILPESDMTFDPSTDDHEQIREAEDALQAAMKNIKDKSDKMWTKDSDKLDSCKRKSKDKPNQQEKKGASTLGSMTKDLTEQSTEKSKHEASQSCTDEIEHTGASDSHDENICSKEKEEGSEVQPERDKSESTVAKVKKKRGRPPKHTTMEPPTLEPHYDPPSEQFLHIDSLSNVSPDSGIQSIAGSPMNSESPNHMQGMGMSSSDSEGSMMDSHAPPTLQPASNLPPVPSPRADMTMPDIEPEYMQSHMPAKAHSTPVKQSAKSTCKSPLQMPSSPDTQPSKSSHPLTDKRQSSNETEMPKMQKKRGRPPKNSPRYLSACDILIQDQLIFPGATTEKRQRTKTVVEDSLQSKYSSGKRSKPSQQSSSESDVKPLSSSSLCDRNVFQSFGALTDSSAAKDFEQESTNQSTKTADAGSKKQQCFKSTKFTKYRNREEIPSSLPVKKKRGPGRPRKNPVGSSSGSTHCTAITSTLSTSKQQQKNSRYEDTDLDMLVQSVQNSIDSQFHHSEDELNESNLQQSQKTASAKDHEDDEESDDKDTDVDESKQQSDKSGKSSSSSGKNRKSKVHVMMRRPKKRGRKKKKPDELPLPDVLTLTATMQKVNASVGAYKHLSTLTMPTLCNLGASSATAPGGSQESVHSDSGIATDSSVIDPDKVPPPSMPVLSPVSKEFPSKLTHPVCDKLSLKSKKRKKKIKHVKSKHKNIVDPVFLADLDSLTQDLVTLTISPPRDRPVDTEESLLPTIFRINKAIMKRKRKKDMHLPKSKRIEFKRDVELGLALREKSRRGRKKKVDPEMKKDDDSEEMVNKEQCLPLKKRHKFVLPQADSHQVSGLDAGMDSLEDRRGDKQIAPTLSVRPVQEKRKVGRPRKHLQPEDKSGKHSGELIFSLNCVDHQAHG